MDSGVGHLSSGGGASKLLRRARITPRPSIFIPALPLSPVGLVRRVPVFRPFFCSFMGVLPAAFARLFILHSGQFFGGVSFPKAAQLWWRANLIEQAVNPLLEVEHRQGYGSLPRLAGRFALAKDAVEFIRSWNAARCVCSNRWLQGVQPLIFE